MKHFLLLIAVCFLCCNNSEVEPLAVKDYSSIHAEAASFCKENNYNESYYFLVDLSVHSGKNRFFIYDFASKKVLDKNLVTHGSCDQFEENPDKWEKVKFDNRVDSHCSMKGKYKIGSRDYSSWGINVKYWLHGLESTNKNAVKRVVVLHSWSAVKNKEIYPRHSPLSWGCPAVSDAFMEKLDERLQQSVKPVLLWVIE
ncbi:murein L,D-transpeptidase catalytic domain-containing protein [Flavobacterium proteolyticum]|uniref:Murein L,D-transpeptidase catalytic domain family protein n=1 Tax=Flavobacterium proteolyticum TaxID=2911683 RepID=A0ABR9WR82_9FLAO|nr:murein L,D-transpeptidase catalytic domain family protein [Flavobacterium proteolyticum]MBE9576367.1 murein L,D-transpeptidase catalytic domain family protein [Flavobacterium proteolyticum]